jgi:glycosyltransferase involved in cell wall biosynthesis
VRENIPFVITAHGPLHDQYLTRDRDRPLESEPLYHNLIWSRRQILNRVARDGRVKRHVENYFMHYPLANASMIVALSNHERALWKRMDLESEVVPNWLDIPFINGLKGETYAEEFPRPLILFVGQFKYRKGFDVLAHAMPFVLEKIPTATFLFVGHSPIHRRELEAITRENGTSEHLKILSRVSEEDKVRLYNTADVMTLPTRYEGFGLPPLEAMASGCPVVASDIPVVDEMIQDEYNGLLVPRDNPRALADALVRMLCDDALRARMIQNGYETLKRYQEAEMLNRLERLYQRITRAPQAVSV